MSYYRFHCEICGYNLVTNGENFNLIEYNRAKIQKEIPKLDPNTSEFIKSTWITLPKKYKCPKCGRLVSPRPYKEPAVENKTKSDYEQDFNSRSKRGIEGF